MITETKAVKDLTKVELLSIQTKLKKLDYYNDEIDGIFGKNTAHAWAEFKTNNWLGETTLIGESSYNLLVEKTNHIKTIDWNNFESKISKYFTTGEVAKHQKQRIPTNKTHQENAVRLALELDKIREWWGSPIGVTSWYRPPHVEKAVGGSGANHPFGYAADIYPIGGDIKNMEKRFQQEWYNTGKWKGGFGRGSKKGFLHLDLRSRRDWNY